MWKYILIGGGILILIVVIFFLFQLYYHPKTNYDSYSNEPIKHDLFTEVLNEHVNQEGFVNYDGLAADRSGLDEYLKMLRSNHPGSNWTEEEKLAYWINAYNAFTLEIVLDHYPLESIRHIRRWSLPFINSVWDIKFIDIQEETYSLNNIEHDILRIEFGEPRIHFAINCASYSCPKLLNEAYSADKLEEQLQAQAIDFINDPLRNKISKDKAEISQIFLWFKGDFTKDGSVMEYVNQFAETPSAGGVKPSHLEYNWDLNKQ